MSKVAAIGTFDGVHRGHRSVLQVLKGYADDHDLEPIAVTFRQHPLALIDPSRVPSELTPLWKKKKLLTEAGASVMAVEFDEELRSTTAREWIRKLREEFGVVALVVGYDNTFGSDGINLSLKDFARIGEEEGVKILTADEVPGVSSSAIRKAVAAGDVIKAGEMLGRPFSITSKVIPGNKLGRTIGFPTANIQLPEGGAIPAPGVYAAIVKLLDTGKKYKAMVNVGRRPTVMRGDDLVVEAHILDWSGDLYGKDITVRFLKRIRDEKKFDSIPDLKEQLEIDKKEILNL